MDRPDDVADGRAGQPLSTDSASLFGRPEKGPYCIRVSLYQLYNNNSPLTHSYSLLYNERAFYTRTNESSDSLRVTPLPASVDFTAMPLPSNTDASAFAFAESSSPFFEPAR